MSLRAWLARYIYDFLDVGRAPNRADCVFVLAGKQERKKFGIKMWRLGFAPQLILSVGRFEWRRFTELNLESDGGLLALVDQTAPPKRHFLVHATHHGTSCILVPKGLLGTYSEAKAMAHYLSSTSIRSLLVVSSPAHLRRAAVAFQRAFRKTGIDLTFVAIPEQVSFDAPQARKEIWIEFIKLLAYQLLKVC